MTANGPAKPPPRTPKERVQITVFALGVCLTPIGAGMAIYPQDPCDSVERARKPASECSTDPVRRDGLVLSVLGLTGVWLGKESLASRRKSSAWDRSWR